jgi:hypothetical protein
LHLLDSGRILLPVMTLDPLVAFGAIGTIVGGVAAAGVAGKWVFGWVFKAMEKDRDFWREAFLRSAGHTGKSLEINEALIKGNG